MATRRNSVLRGLYVITDAKLIGGERLLPAVENALQGGARLVQYRDKGEDRPRRRREAGALLELCRDYDVPLIVNDDIALAADVGADGVHLGLSDASPVAARRRLGAQAIIGVTCHADPDAPYVAHADYAAFGRFFASGTKPDAPVAPLSVLTEARAKLDIPVAAIGGINADNAAQVIEAGADMLAVVAGVFAAEDFRTAAEKLSAMFN